MYDREKLLNAFKSAKGLLIMSFPRTLLMPVMLKIRLDSSVF